MENVTRSYYDSDAVDLTWLPDHAVHMYASHKITTEQADEAANDPFALWDDPDPASKSGVTSRITGYSKMRQEVLCVIVCPLDDIVYGINAWPANSTYKRRYSEGQSNGY